MRARPPSFGLHAPLAGELEVLLARFDISVRPELRRMLHRSTRFGEFAAVFPGAAYAMASRRGPPAARQRALRLIVHGAPLKEVARTLGLPMWLRRLPPEAFDGPLAAVPASETFSRRIANRLPAAGENSAFWLATLTFAVEACHEDFALWLADQPVFAEAGEPARLFAILAAYASVSGGPACRAKSLIVVPWRGEIAFDTALCAAKSWLNRLRLVIQLGQGAIGDSWFTPGIANGFSFSALADTETILAEAHAMQNCADQYAERLSRDRCRLFSIRKAGVRVATMEIGAHPRETGVLTITQLKARHNMPANVEVWQAAHAWLAQQPGLKRLPPISSPERPLDNDLWTHLLEPYRQSAGGAPWLPTLATHHAMSTLDSGLADVARRAGVTSWLFT